MVNKTTVIFFSEFRWSDLGFLGKILIFLGFLGKINCRDFGKKYKESKILATNSRLSKINQDLGKKTKTPSTGRFFVEFSQKISSKFSKE